MQHGETSGDILSNVWVCRKSKMPAPLTGSTYEITNISTCIHDSTLSTWSTLSTFRAILSIAVHNKIIIIIIAILHRSWDTALFHIYFRFWQPSLSYHFSRRLRVFKLFLRVARPRKCGCRLWNFVVILCTIKLRYTYFKFTGRHLGFSTSGSFPFNRTTLPLFPLDSWTLKT